LVARRLALRPLTGRELRKALRESGIGVDSEAGRSVASALSGLSGFALGITKGILQPPGVCPGDREKARNLPDNWQMSALSHFQKQMSDKAATKTFYAPLCPAIHNLYVANKSAPRDRLRIACQMG